MPAGHPAASLLTARAVRSRCSIVMAQVEAGRSPEIDALVGSVVELGRLTGTPTPHIDTVYALVKLLAQMMDTQHGKLRLQPVSP